ncbi:thioredoxin family protein [uncultured Victivallis sp.]|uniref:thioredoxin family protein n=1 Tax=uncultured Victivallis sp. TaxID=354118 RepID=UPI0025F571E5|nr:thioredoxin family protein [uncultured Victivallis sp.]
MRERSQIIRGMLLWTGITLFGIGAFAAATLNAGPVTSPEITEKNSGELLWSEDFEKASALAKTEKKPLLMYFTGSDWCGWCKKLHAEVLDRPEFSQWAGKNVVLFKADFPEELAQSQTIKDQNNQLARKYRISGFPTVILADADGKVIARTGYKPGGAAAYVKHLQALLKK